MTHPYPPARSYSASRSAAPQSAPSQRGGHQLDLQLHPGDPRASTSADGRPQPVQDLRARAVGPYIALDDATAPGRLLGSSARRRGRRHQPDRGHGTIAHSTDGYVIDESGGAFGPGATLEPNGELRDRDR